MKAVNRSCPACGDRGGRVLARLAAREFCETNSTYRSDWAKLLDVVPDEEFPLVSCRECGFAFAGHLPEPGFLARIYDEVIDPEQGRRESCRPAWMAHLLWVLVPVLEELDRRHGLSDRPLRVLDIGCGYGQQLRALSVPGSPFEVLGLEISPRARAAVSAQGLPVVADADEVSGTFDLILLNEVLEHLPDFRECLARVRSWLSPGGLAWIAVPDFSTWRLEAALAARRMGRPLPRDLNLWEHLNLFSPATLRRVAVEAGLSRVALRAEIPLPARSAPGWRQPRGAADVVRQVARWAVFGPPSRTQLLVERAPI